MVTSSSAGKFGSKHSMDMMYVGMQTGIYIFDLGNDGTVFNNNSKSGYGTVLGNDCVRYNLITAPDGGTDYYMYQDNLMLKRVAATSTDGSTIEALSFDNTTTVPESLFELPPGVIYY
jgi:hypothetical protein